MAVALSLGTLSVFGPHLSILAYKLAGARPPAALLFFCVLHHSSARSSPALVIGAGHASAAR
jgi:hypothetical protein